MWSQGKRPWSHIDFKQSVAPRTVYKGGISFQETIFLEGGITRAVTFRQVSKGLPLYRGYTAGLEVAVTGDRFLFAPKVGYELNLRYVAARLATSYYTDLKTTSDWRLTPEAGLCFYGIFGVFYGYNIQLLSGTFNDVSPHRVAFYFFLIK